MTIERIEISITRTKRQNLPAGYTEKTLLKEVTVLEDDKISVRSRKFPFGYGDPLVVEKNDLKKNPVGGYHLFPPKAITFMVK